MGYHRLAVTHVPDQEVGVQPRQLTLFRESVQAVKQPPRGQLLKWIGNKQRFAAEIVSYFPSQYKRYLEPFLGSGAILATLSPDHGIGSDSFRPLMEIWQTLKSSPDALIEWYTDRWSLMALGDKLAVYEEIKARYNAAPNGPDLLFLSRSCYGGVVRFRQTDGYMSTPCGPHTPIRPSTFAERVAEWHSRVQHCDFAVADYAASMDQAGEGDLIYCDPPYADSQSILYGAQAFRLSDLIDKIAECKARGVLVALSIDGTKRSGRKPITLRLPTGVFEREVLVDVGRSMLKRFQMNGRTLEHDVVRDRLLLTY
jgi:DNA adenine methylase